MTAKDIIEELELKVHPEGGFYKETYRSEYSVNTGNDRERNVCTAIYFLLNDSIKSNFHRIKSDELWFFHMGEPLEIFYFENDYIRSITLGSDIKNGELLQAMIPANTWFASKVKYGQGFSLVSCTVSPGFDFADFELAEREDLLNNYPESKIVVEEFTP